MNKELYSISFDFQMCDIFVLGFKVVFFFNGYLQWHVKNYETKVWS